MEKLQALEAEVKRRHGCRVLIIQVKNIPVGSLDLVSFNFDVSCIYVQADITCEDIFILLTLMLTVFATQADFTDVSVLPVIVSRLKEEQVEVSIFGCPVNY